MKHLKLILICLILLASLLNTKAQTDVSSETNFNQSSYRVVSGNETRYSSNIDRLNIPLSLLNAYSIAGDTYNNTEKQRLGLEIDNYLVKMNSKLIDPWEYQVQYEENNYQTDWYNNDIQVVTGDVGNSSHRTMDLKTGEDGRMYIAYVRRNVIGSNGSLRIFQSGNGGASWPTNIFWNYNTVYIQSISMLVERRDDNNDDSTRIFIYFIGSTSSNFDNASLYLFSARRNATGVYTLEVAAPQAGNKFTHVSACSDGAYFESGTATHVVFREETNAGAYVRMHHLRSLNWGLTHTGGTFPTGFNDQYPSAAFSIQSGIDSLYIAMERRIANDEYEIRLLSTSEAPLNSYNVRFITDAAVGTLYEKPAITVQQRSYLQPQNVLVTCTKNSRAVYHSSTNGGASWNIDFALGGSNQVVDFTSCSSDTLTAGGGYFMAVYVDNDGDSLSIRRGVIGNLGSTLHKKNSNQSTGVLAPACAIYKEGLNKYGAFAYTGSGPTDIYYNMENLVTGIQSIGNNLPDKFNLSQNHPNPFNPATNIQFSIPKSSFVKLVVYDIQGRKVETLVNQQVNAGTYNADWNAARYSSGIYFYKLETDGYTETKKMMLVK